MNKLEQIYKFSSFSSFSIIFTGCKQPTFINLTSTNISQNLWNLHFKLKSIFRTEWNPDTVEVSAVGGELISTVQDPINQNLWSCDYKLPSGFDEATYYFQVNYRLNKDGLSSSQGKKANFSHSDLRIAMLVTWLLIGVQCRLPSRDGFYKV